MSQSDRRTIKHYGSYIPERYKKSPPQPPEGYDLTEEEWKEITTKAKKRRDQQTSKMQTFQVEEPTAPMGKERLAVEEQRKQELEARKADPPAKSFWGSFTQKLRYTVQDFNYSMSASVADSADRDRKEHVERAYKRFEGLLLDESEQAAAGQLIGCVCTKTAVRGQCANGYLFITERLLIFDGEMPRSSGASSIEPRNIRFSIPLVKIASFEGGHWKGESFAGLIPKFYDWEDWEQYTKEVSARKDSFIDRLSEQEPNSDALFVYDQDGYIHRFWGFGMYCDGSKCKLMCVLNMAWRTAMLVERQNYQQN